MSTAGRRLLSTWERERKHLLIGEALPDWYHYKYTYTWAMNYAKPEVRVRKLAIVNELCSNYDVDGIEFDFLRHWFYFKSSEEEAGIPLMNDFIRSVRKRLDEIGQQRGKRLRLVVRVPSTLRMCRRVGLDAPTWIQEGLVDLVVAMDPGHLDITADVASFDKLAEGTDCKIASGPKSTTRVSPYKSFSGRKATHNPYSSPIGLPSLT